MPVNYESPDVITDFSSLKYFRRLEHISIDLEKLKSFLLNLPKESWDPVTHQICFTHTPFDYDLKPALLHEGCGSLTYQWSFKPYDGQKQLHKRARALTDKDFTVFNHEFIGTPVHEAYLKLQAHYPVGRLRLMKLTPKKCMSWHSDDDVRIHFAVVTEKSCRMVIEDEAIHIPADGTAYLCHTQKFHTAFNGSHHCERIHLVAGLHPTSPLFKIP